MITGTAVAPEVSLTGEDAEMESLAAGRLSGSRQPIPLAPAMPIDLESATLLSAQPRGPEPRKQVVLQRFEGAVISVSARVFLAEICDVSDANRADEEVELSMEELDDEDAQMVTRGAIFDWTIGFELLPGEKKRFSVIKFRRLPQWSERELEDVRAKARELAARLR